MPPRRSPAVTLLGVANLVLGTLGILCACGNGGWMVLMGIISQDEPDLFLKEMIEGWNFLLQNIPGYLQIEIALAIFHLAISILAIIAGVGLMSLKNWGRVLAFIYGLTMILVEGAYLLFFFAFVTPVLNQFEARQGGLGGGLMGSGSLDALGSLIIVIYATVLVIVLFLPGIAAEFAGKPADLPEDDW